MSETFTKAVMMLAAAFTKKLSDMEVTVHAQIASQELTLEQFNKACMLWIKSGEKFYPNNIMEVVQLVKKPVSNEDQASQLSALLVKAVQDFGRRWDVGSWRHVILDGETKLEKTFQGSDTLYLNWEHAALSVFGQVGLTLVNRHGGWERFCEYIDNSPETVTRAQVKNLATSLLNTVEKTGSFEVPLSLSPSKDSVLIGNVLQLPIKEMPK